MDIQKMREDLRGFCGYTICEGGCPLYDQCDRSLDWDEQDDESILEMWKIAFPNKSIPVSQDEKAVAAEFVSLKSQLSQQEKAYATLMDQFNKLQAEKNSLQDAVDRLCREKKELQDINDCNLGVIHTWEETCENRKKQIADLQAENKKLMEKLDAAEKELEKEVRTLNAEIDYRNHLIEDNSNLVRKNDRIVSAVADLFRKIMVD